LARLIFVVVQEKKDDGAGLNLEGLKEFVDSRSQDLICGPGIFSEKPGKTGERSGEEGTRQRLNHGRGMPFFSQLDKAHDEGRKDFERGA